MLALMGATVETNPLSEVDRTEIGHNNGGWPDRRHAEDGVGSLDLVSNHCRSALQVPLQVGIVLAPFPSG